MAQGKLKIRRDDQVMVTAGKEKGKTGKVIRVDRERGAVLVEKINMVKRHTKPTQQQKEGGIVEKEAPIDISNIMLLCAKCSKPVKVGRKALDDGSLVRFCRKCGEVLDK